MGNVKICTDNFLDSDVVSNATVSSEQAAFPVSNLYNYQRRSKVWRSDGYYSITTSNNVIVFRETALVDLTATLTVGEYDSFTLLAAEIKTQLEAAGASTYTISQDVSTQKVKIVSNGVGGGGIFQIIWTSTAVTQAVANMLGFLTTEDDTGALTYKADQLKIGNGEWIKWDFGISTNPKCFVLIGSRNKPIQISPSAVIKLQASETDVWTSPTYEQTLTYNDSVISIFSDTGLHTEALRFWRLFISDISNPNGYVEIGTLFLGDYISPTQGAIQYPFGGEFIDSSNVVYSEGGQSYSDVRQKTEAFNFEMLGLTVTEKELIDQHWSNVGISRPFFIVLDPNAVYSSTENYYIRYVKFSSAPRYELIQPNIFRLEMNLREEL